MAKPPPSKENKEIADLQAKLAQLKQQHESGKVVQSEASARAFLEQVSAVAAQIAAMGDAVVKGDEKRRQELQESAEAIQSLLKHMPGMKG